MPSWSSIVRGSFMPAVTVARCDPRRPAAVAAFATAAVAGFGPAPPWLCGVIGAMAAVAAMGELPTDPRGTSAAPPVFLVAAGRLVMPLLGLLAAAVVDSLLRTGVHVGAVTTASVAVVSTAAATAAMRSAGVSPCDAAAASLAVAVAAAACGVSSPWIALGWPVAAAVTAWGCIRLVAGEPADLPRLRGRTAWYAPVPGQGKVRGRLTAIAMAACLAGMVGWLLRDPPDLRAYATLAIAVLAALAIPMATLGDGGASRREWSAVMCFARPTGPLRRWGRDWPPYARIAYGYAAVVAWPLLVAAVVPGPGGPRFPGQHLVATAAVGLVATAIVVLARTLSRRDVSPATAQAVLLLALAIAARLGSLPA